MQNRGAARSGRVEPSGPLHAPFGGCRSRGGPLPNCHTSLRRRAIFPTPKSYSLCFPRWVTVAHKPPSTQSSRVARLSACWRNEPHARFCTRICFCGHDSLACGAGLVPAPLCPHRGPGGSCQHAGASKNSRAPCTDATRGLERQICPPPGSPARRSRPSVPPCVQRSSFARFLCALAPFQFRSASIRPLLAKSWP
jgi:hypothetical protein